ncbi:hypothetical protein [Actinokineospora sp.]|uniref:hypothetical protein n=1 Tax=Actinokineospora sp. TaxID=1872133 RepID=UPI003D6BC303
MSSSLSRKRLWLGGRFGLAAGAAGLLAFALIVTPPAPNAARYLEPDPAPPASSPSTSAEPQKTPTAPEPDTGAGISVAPKPEGTPGPAESGEWVEEPQDEDFQIEEEPIPDDSTPPPPPAATTPAPTPAPTSPVEPRPTTEPPTEPPTEETTAPARQRR